LIPRDGEEQDWESGTAGGAGGLGDLPCCGLHVRPSLPFLCIWQTRWLIHETIALFVWTYQHNQQPSSSVFLSQQTSKQYFQHNEPAKRTGCMIPPLFVRQIVVFGLV
jgi:hypothetical protein